MCPTGRSPNYNPQTYSNLALTTIRTAFGRLAAVHHSHGRMPLQVLKGAGEGETEVKSEVSESESQGPVADIVGLFFFVPLVYLWLGSGGGVEVRCRSGPHANDRRWISIGPEEEATCDDEANLEGRRRAVARVGEMRRVRGVDSGETEVESCE